MSYGEIYRIYVPSIRHNTYVVEIEQKDYTGSSTVLKGGGEPFVTTLDDDDFVYQPLRLSTAKLLLVGDDALASLFATTYQEYRVTLLKNGVPLWCGFIKPELYTQDYSTPTHEISIDCLSAISALEFVKYTQLDSAGLQFVSLKSLISRAVLAANGRYGKVYIPHTFVNTSTDSTNVLMRDDCVISEQNFFDEEDKPMSYKDILEEICRFSHTTLYDDYGNLYFVDHDYTGRYDEWTLVGGSLSLTTADALFVGTQSVQDIGFGGSGHSLDVIAGYNKATVKTNNYNNADKVFPEEDWDKLSPLSIELTQVSIIQAIKSATQTTYKEANVRGKCIWLTPIKWQPRVYAGTGVTKDGVNMATLKVGSNDAYYNGGTTIYEGVSEITDLTNLQFDASTFAHALSSTLFPMTAYETNQGFSTLRQNGLSSNPTRLYGAFLGKYCNWDLNEDKTDSITSYSYEQIMFIRKFSDIADDVIVKHDSITFDAKANSGFFNYRGHMPVAAYADGAIAISLQVVPTSQYQPASVSGVARNGFYYANEKKEFKSTDFYITFEFKLRIGDKYYNGTSWVASEATFTVTSEKIETSGTYVALHTNKVLSMPYNDLSGYVIETSGLQKGELYMELVDVSSNCAIKDFSLKFQLKDNYVPDDNSSDRIYSNVVNADYINELDEIEEKISSYNHDGLCYSKVLLGNDYITDNLYETINNTTTRPEELLLRRLVNQYEHPKIKLTQVLMNSNENLRPIDKLTDTYQLAGKKFVITGKETSYRSDTSEIKMIEKA